MWNWIVKTIFWPWRTPDQVESGVEDIVRWVQNDDLRELVLDAQTALDEDEKNFIVSLKLPEDMKVRTAKTLIETALLTSLQAVSKDITEVRVRSYYRK